MGFLPQVFLSACMLFTVGFPPVHLTPMGFPPLGFPPLGLLPVGFRLWAVCLWAFQQWASRLWTYAPSALAQALGPAGFITVGFPSRQASVLFAVEFCPKVNPSMAVWPLA